MPSGAAAQQSDQSTDAAAMGAGGGAEGADVDGVTAVGEAGAAAALAALGRARAGAEAAMHPATAVFHGRLATTAAGTGAGATAGRGQEITRPSAVP